LIVLNILERYSKKYEFRKRRIIESLPLFQLITVKTVEIIGPDKSQYIVLRHFRLKKDRAVLSDHLGDCNYLLQRPFIEPEVGLQKKCVRIKKSRRAKRPFLFNSGVLGAFR